MPLLVFFEEGDTVQDTIAAISTAQGAGGIGIVRISGESAIDVADRVFCAVSGKTLKSLSGYRAAFGKVWVGGEPLDEAVAVVYRAPLSYTGENVAELCCHGGMYITSQLLRAVLQSGARPAEPGEFTRRAFENGKVDLTEAEAVMDIISAKSRAGARAAMSIRSGALRRRIDSVKSALLDKAAHLNAWADFPEEDIPQISPDELKKTLSHCIGELTQLLSTYDSGQAVSGGIDTVIAGKPNVGKSTLMNLLSGFDKSIVTEIPGTTRDVVEQTVVVGDVVLRLSDTAGLRDTDNPVERIGVDRARQRLGSCGLVLAVFDSADTLSDEDMTLLDSIGDIPAIAVINKSDLQPKIDMECVRQRCSRAVSISAKTGDGRGDLIKAVAEVAGTTDFDASAGIIANERQRAAAAEALGAVTEAQAALDAGFSYDAVTVNIEQAVECLLQFTGESVSEAVVDKVFHSFCVGK